MPFEEESYAAVDLGSNSFHMVVANFSEGNLRVIDRMKEMVRFASGLNNKKDLSEESMQVALECLQRFGQRIQEIPNSNVRAVGTNTLRLARNKEVFLTQAHAALGHPIEIIAGREEARLIYSGVAHSSYDETSKRLVIDIGGGSTELIIGRGFDTFETESLHMGCVNVGLQFFEDGKIKPKRMRKAFLSAMQELESIGNSYKTTGWDYALGSSGTILAIRDVVQAQGWCDSGITANALARLIEALIAIGDSEMLNFEGLSDRRKPVFASGVAILSAIFEALELNNMNVSDGALREGLLYDLIGRTHNKDIRDQTISAVVQRYNIDSEQANRVKDTAKILFDQVKVSWQLNEKNDLKILEWGAMLHEIGLSVAHYQYHKHGAYLTANSDLAGFSQQDQKKLAMLVRSHRRKFPAEEIQAINPSIRSSLTKLCILLRLAVVLHRGRSGYDFPKIDVKVIKDNINLMFPSNWLEQHPLTLLDLSTERDYLQAANIQLVF
ncbi:MAG: exopolyphosphatase [Nitrosomonas sp.]